MMTVTLSSKYQVVIPKELRELLGLRQGQNVQVIAYENRIELIPVRRMKDLRGFLPGLDTKVKRDPDQA